MKDIRTRLVWEGEGKRVCEGEAVSKVSSLTLRVSPDVSLVETIYGASDSRGELYPSIPIGPSKPDTYRRADTCMSWVK